jgi:Asp-tRNA(Asn)/Glu-tRNA(Gln) amidotransferase A subunit family amidase
MAKCVDDCVLALKSFLNPKNYENLSLKESDPYFNLKPFDEEMFKSNKPLLLGYFKTNKFCDTSLANQRAVDIAVSALREKGHNLVEIELEDFEKASLAFVKLVKGNGLDGNRDMVNLKNLNNNKSFILEFI